MAPRGSTAPVEGEQQPHPDSPAAVKEFDTPEPPATVGSQDENASEGSGDTNPQTDRSNALRAAYGEATATLRERHRTEFDALYVAAARKRGVDYKPKPTPEQKAEAEVEELLTKYPHLREKFAGADPGDTDEPRPV